MTTYEYGFCCGQLARVNNPDGTWLGYEYDANKNITARLTPWGTTRYTFDRLNRMDSVIAPDGAVTRYLYNAVGNRDSVVHANGTSVGYAYDALNRLLSVTNYGPDGSVQSRFTYELNPAGIRTAVVEADGSRVQYSYDDLYRLTGETRTGTHPYTIAFAYDNVGNRLTQTRDGVTISYSYNDRDQLMSETVAGVTTRYAYDRAGRLVSKTDASGTTTYGWLDNDRMVSVNGPDVSVSYVYDHEGRRVEETTSAGTRRYLIDGLLPYGQVVAETDGSGALTAAYVYGLERIAQARGGVTRTYAADGQGSIRNLTDASGNVTDNYWYTAFGEELASTGITPNSFRYTGEQWDANAGWYYLRARWMSPEQGRFLSVDPWDGSPHMPSTLHRYAYAHASPVSFRDPTGRFSLAQALAPAMLTGIIASWAKVPGGYFRCAATVLREFVATRFGLLRLGESVRYSPTFGEARGNDGRISFPFMHCVWNCRMARAKNVEYAVGYSALKEHLDNLSADARDRLQASGCWEGGGLHAQKVVLEAEACSADQPCDYADNATGRKCGTDLATQGGGGDDGECESCCAKAGVTTETQDGPGTSRAYGPRCKDEKLAEEVKRMNIPPLGL